VPDLFAHFASSYLISREAHLRQYTSVFVLGAVLPDILTRIPEIILDRFLGIPIFHFVVIFHAPFCLLLVSFVISLMLEFRTRLMAFFFILLGSYLHVVLDLMQKQFGQGVYMPYFPFSFETLQWGLFHFNASIALFPILLVSVVIAWIFTR
jgi:hypothetical protein